MLALLGRRAPASLKLFLTTVAIVDDLGAVAIIALAYTDALDPLALGAAAAILARACYALGRRGVRALWPYLLGAALLWYRGAAVGRPRDRRRRARRGGDPDRRTPGAPDDARFAAPPARAWRSRPGSPS